MEKHVQWVYIPAVKDASDEQAEAKNSAFGKLLARAVRGKVDFADSLSAILAGAQQQYQQLLTQHQGALEEITVALSKRLVEWAHPDAALKVQWLQDSKKSVQVEEPLAGVRAKEGMFEGQLARFGHGLQRSFLISLLQELAVGTSAGPTLILGCEEPELYQHPPQARHLASVLSKLASEAQIILTTHSPYFVNGSCFESVRLVQKLDEGSGSAVRSYTFEKFADDHAVALGSRPVRAAGAMASLAQIMQPELSEMFFAKRLILVEGLEDAAYIRSWVELTGASEHFRSKGVHIVPTQGKSFLLRPLLIARSFSMPTYVVFDLDSDADAQKLDLHRRDNVALLRTLGGNEAEPFPSDDIVGERFAAWKTNLGATVRTDFEPGDWRAANDFASNQCGLIRGLEKNPLHIAYRLSWLLDRGHRSATLDRLIGQIAQFALLPN